VCAEVLCQGQGLSLQQQADGDRMLPSLTGLYLEWPSTISFNEVVQLSNNIVLVVCKFVFQVESNHPLRGRIARAIVSVCLCVALLLLCLNVRGLTTMLNLLGRLCFCFCICLYVISFHCLLIHLSLRLSTYLSACLLVCLPVCLFACVPVSQSVG